jgi:hypothetical protein
MTDFDRWFEIAKFDIPMYIVLVGGMIAAIVVWKKYPRPALLIFLGLLVYTISEVANPIITVWRMVYKPDSALYGLVSIIYYPLSLIGLTLLIWGAFGWRNPAVNGQYPPQPIYGMPYPQAVNYPPQYPPQPQYPQYPQQPGAYPNYPGGFPPPPPTNLPPAPRPYPPDEPTQVG